MTNQLGLINSDMVRFPLSLPTTGYQLQTKRERVDMGKRFAFQFLYKGRTLTAEDLYLIGEDGTFAMQLEYDYLYNKKNSRHPIINSLISFFG